MAKRTLLIWSIVVVAVAGFAGWLIVRAKPGVPEPPPSRKIRTVVLITIDTLRADALPCYGNPRVAAPTIAALAAEGIVFDEAISTSCWTRPAVASLLTGLPPSVNGITSPKIEIDPGLPADWPTLAEAMFDAGYRTAAFGFNPFLAHTPSFGRGFRDFHMQPQLNEHGRSMVTGRQATKWITDRGIEWLDEHRDEPCFLWLHYYDPHTAYEPPRDVLHDDDWGRQWTVPADGQEYVTFVDQFNLSLAAFLAVSRGLADIPDESLDPTAVAVRETGREKLREMVSLIRGFYEAEVRDVDRAIGRVVARLRAHGRYDDALIALTSDHGEELFDHDEFEHGHTLHRELVQVPLILRMPRGQGATRVRRRVSTLSLRTTLLDLCGIGMPKSQRLAPALLGPRGGERWDAAYPHVIAEAMLYGRDRIAVYLDGTDLKYVRESETDREWLYRLSFDPHEQTSVASEDPESCAEGRRAADAYLAWAKAFRDQLEIVGATRDERGDALRKLLRAHGYLK